MKRLAAGILALGLLAGVTACKPSEEEVAKQADCVREYIKNRAEALDPDDLTGINKELEAACGVKENFLHPEP